MPVRRPEQQRPPRGALAGTGKTRIHAQAGAGRCLVVEVRASKAWLKQFERVAQARKAQRIGAPGVFEFTTPAGIVADRKRDPPQVHVGVEIVALELEHAFVVGACTQAATAAEPHPTAERVEACA